MNIPIKHSPASAIPPLDPAHTQSADLLKGNIAQLKALFPEAFKEGGIDFEVLKQLLGGQVDEREEKYGLNWHGKRRARQIALTPSTGTLRPCPGESVDWDTTQNLMIEGDNLEVLKLLQKSYAGKVKMIYIDPPYNTGKDFVYPDNFTDNIKNYLELTGQTDGEGRKLSSNTEASGRFHTDWLNMMYPRLKLARNLLREDGVIVSSIEDGEIVNLRKLFDEIFGEENFVVNAVWKKKQGGGNDSINFVSEHEYLVMYAKNIASLRVNLDSEHVLDDALYPFNDSVNDYGLVTLDKSSIQFSQSLVFEIRDTAGNSYLPRIVKGKQSCWRWGRDKVEADFADLVFKDGKVYTRYYRPAGVVAKSLLTDSRFGRTETGKDEVKSLFDAEVFSYPKPNSLIRHFVSLCTNSNTNDVCLDFFAGSGTTGEAVLNQNKLDNGNRSYVLVQFPESLSIESKEQKTAADYCDRLGKPRNIAELTKERLRRAAIKIGAACARNDSATAQLSLENEAKTPKKPLDLGFKVFKLDTSNIRAWNPNPDELADTLMAHTEHLAAGRSEADVLYEVLLKQGLDLALPVQRQVIAGHTVHSVGAGALLVCLARDVTGQWDTSTGSVRTGDVMAEFSVTAANAEALALGIADWHAQLAAALGQTPQELHTRVVLRDSLFDGDVAKTNLTAILRQRGLEDVRSL